MKLTPSSKAYNDFTERLTTWTEQWGLSFVFSVTQSVEAAERIVSESVALLLTPETATSFLESSTSNQAVQFAMALWGLSSKEAYRGFGSDPFFKMPVLTRAIVTLKVKAKFSREQISQILEVDSAQISSQLENARLLFSDGKNWIPHTNTGKCQTQLLLQAGSAQNEKLQEIFVHYLGNDLDRETSRKLHEHMVACDECRNSFSQFKNQYQGWTTSVPTVEFDREMKKHLLKISHTSLKFKRVPDSIRPPSVMVGVRKVWNDPRLRIQLQAILLGAFSAIAMLWLFKQ